MDAELRQHLSSMEQRLLDRIEASGTALERRVVDRLETFETKLLTAFHDWARPVEIRLRTLPMLEERLGLLEERISKIERGDKPANGSRNPN
jgi:hypothetical protein